MIFRRKRPCPGDCVLCRPVEQEKSTAPIRISLEGNCLWNSRGNQGSICTERDLRGYNEVYITPSALESFVKLIQECRTMRRILNTPCLISQDPDAIFELRYYEFHIDVLEGASHFVEYNERNCLPSEITKSIKPKAIVSPETSGFILPPCNTISPA